MQKNLKKYNDPKFKPSTLVELVRWRAVTKPNQRAYTYLKDGGKKEIHMTYADLDQAARAIATNLQRKGLSGQRALLLYPPGLDYITGFFGCLYADVIAVPAYPPDPNRLNRSLPRLQAIVNDAGATVALTNDSIMYMIRMLKLGSKLTSTLEKMPFLRKFRTTMKYFSTSKNVVAESRELGDLQWLSTDSVPSSLSEEWKEPKITPETISFLQYTSGSTGTPKGVILTHANLLHNSKVIFDHLNFDKNSEGVFWIPIYHDMGLIGGVLQPLYGEIPSTLMSPIAFLQRPLSWLDAISKLPVETTVGSAAPNFAYELCIKKATPEKVAQLDLRNWKMALSGAEPVRYQTIERFTEIFKPAGFQRSAFLPAYGLAESTLFVSGADFHKEPVSLTVDKYALKKNKIIEVPVEDENSQSIVSCGIIPKGQKAVIVNPDTFKENKVGEIGEIWVKGESVSRGYYERPEETKETFHNYLADSGDGPYLRTGDLGFIRDNQLYVTGRVKDLIIIRGTNHYPQDIELTCEQSHQELRPGCCAAFTVEENNEEQLVIVQELRHSKNVNFDEIFQAIRQNISENHDLQVYAIVLIKARSINKTSSGKIQRRATKNEFLDEKLSVVAEWKRSLDTAPKVETREAEITEDAELAEETQAAPVAKSGMAKNVEQWMVNNLAEMLNIAPKEVDIRQPFISFGLDSAQAVGLAGDLEEYLGRELPPTLIWDYPTIEALAKYLVSEDISPAAVKTHRARRTEDYEPIAVIGIGARFPGSANHSEFWQMLKNGVDGISEVPPDRWDADAFYDPNPATPGKMITKNGGFIDNVDLFDAQFFGISPREAVQMDPQQRLLLEVVWEAFEHAGKPLDKISGSRTAVFVGISTNDYSRIQKGGYEQINPYSGTGNAFSIAANRLSYIFDLHGPSVSIDTACSSSLVAVHNACLSLRDGDCDMALAGGVNLILSPELTITFSQARMMSTDGRCRTFDASTEGYGRGEGAGIVLLKRLSDAVRDKDNIIGVIKGSAVNQDGRSNGITAPNSLSQQAVINEALDNAGLAPDQVNYIETHGTATPLGDPIEIQSIKKVMLQERAKDNLLYLGSVKTNIGHLESAAGIAGFIKVLMSLQNEEIPPHLHLTKLNPHIKIDDVPIRIATENITWKTGDSPRYAGISSFGFGGTNAHVILEEAPRKTPAESSADDLKEKERLLTVSAHNEEALLEMAGSYSHFIRNSLPATAQALYDMLYTAALKRSHHDFRLAVTGKNADTLADELEKISGNAATTQVVTGQVDPNNMPKVAFVFSGQGPQWWAMGRELYENEPIFRATIERISFLLKEYCEWTLTEELLKDEATTCLDETEIAQPALFAIQVALAALWRTWGVLPEAVVGHSVGEVAAAHVSGILSLESAVKVIYHRGRLMQKATGLGKMAAVDLPYDELKEIVADYEDRLSLGARNSHTSNVISGEEKAVDAVLQKLEEKDVFYKKLPVNYAFHSPQMQPFKQELTETLTALELQKMHIPIVSTVRGDYAQDDDYAADYWGRNIRECVQFSGAIDTLIGDGFNFFIEIGPHPVLKHYIRQNLEAGQKEAQIRPSLRRKEPEHNLMLTTLGHLYTRGYPVDWHKIYRSEGNFIELPPYPFQRERFWITDEQPKEAVALQPAKEDVHPLLGREQPSALFPQNSSWTVQLKADYVAYLNNNRKDSHPMLPEAAYLEMAVAASRQTFHGERTILKNIVFKNVLKLRKDESRQLHFTLTPISPTRAYFQAFSKTSAHDDRQNWTMHSLGSIVNENDIKQAKESRLSLEELKGKLRKQSNAGQIFDPIRQKGYILDTLIESTNDIWTGQNEILTKMTIRAAGSDEMNNFYINPFVLNNCFQLLNVAAQMDEPNPKIYAPHSLNYLKLNQRMGNEVWVYVKLSRQGSDMAASESNQPARYSGRDVDSDLIIADRSGNILLELQGLKLHPLPMDIAYADIFYETDWEKLDAVQIKTNSKHLPANWFILSDSNGYGEKLALKLESKSKRCIIARIGEENKQDDNGDYLLNPENKKDFSNILQEIMPEDAAIVYMWGLEEEKHRRKDISDFVEVIDKLEIKPAAFYVFSRSALSIPAATEDFDPEQAFFWDQVRSLLARYPELYIRQIDIDGKTNKLFDVLHLPANENQIAIRNNDYYAVRLNPIMDLSSDSQEHFDQLKLPAQKRKAVGPGLVEIKVKAAGINHRDIQIIKDPAAMRAQKLGIECAGIVSAVGDKDSPFKVGDEVIAIAPGCLNEYALARAQLVKPKPGNVSFEEAASIPFSYLTAFYALSYLGRIQQNEKVLILDATTPLGLASIHIAKQFNAEIFITVDKPERKAFFNSMGINHVFDRHSLAYVDYIARLTEGNGVDIIVNTRSNELLPSSFSIMKEFGRFLELNTDGSFHQPLVYHNLRRNIAFFAIDMENVAADQPQLLQRLFDEVSELMAKGDFSYPKNNIFSVQELGQACYLLEKYKKIGNYVLSFQKNGDGRRSTLQLLEETARYLIAGTFDQNDLALLDWMIQQGARNFVLTGIGKTEIPEKEIKKRLSKDIKMDIILPDSISDFSDIKGIIVSAGSVPVNLADDAVLEDLHKIYEETFNLDPDFFISTSFFDIIHKKSVDRRTLRLDQLLLALNHQRQQDGLPALHLQLAGEIPQTLSEALPRWTILKYFLFKKTGDVIISEKEWEVIFKDTDPDEIPGIYHNLISRSKPEKLAGKQSDTGVDISRVDLLAEAQEKRKAMLESYLISEIARVIKVDSKKIKKDQSLISLGIDSLMAIELKNTVEGKLGVNLPIATLLQGPSINDLTAQFLPQLEEGEAPEKKEKKIKKISHQIEEYPLSYGQKAMYFQHVMNPESIFNLAYAVRIRSEFDKDKLVQSFQALVDRHPSLRTTFHINNGKPIQRIHPDMPAFFYEEELAGWDEDQIKNRFDEEVLRHFDLENGPLMRVFLFKRAEADYFLLFVMHHIVTDIWSQALLLNELSLIFDQPDDLSPLPEMVYDYTDYIQWQDDLLKGDKGSKLLGYWKNRLSGELPILNIPTDRPRPAVQTYRGKTETIWFGEALSKQIHEFSEKHNVTTFTLLLAAYYVFLHRYTGQDDIIVGSPTAGRSKSEFADIIGYFVNPVPFRAKLIGNPAFSNFLQQVKTTALEAFDNMDYPLSLMVEKIQPQRDSSRTPFFQTMFIMQRAHLMHDEGLSKFALSREGASLKLGGLTIESMNLEQGVAPFDLTMMTVESGSGLAASLGYNIDLFDQKTVQRMLMHYVNLLGSIISSPDAPVSKLDLLSDDETRHLLRELNQTAVKTPADKCVHQLIEEQAGKHPEKTALTFDDQQMSYQELNRRANQLARYLQSEGVGHETLVGVCVERSPEMVIAMLGVIKAGGAYVPIDPSYPQERIRYMFMDSNLSVILTQRHLMNKLTGHKAKIVHLDNGQDTIWKQQDHNPECTITPQNLAYVIYTSGSTGKPKGTMLQHRGLINALMFTRQKYYMTEDAQVLQFASFSFDASVEEIFSTLTVGATLHLVRKETILSLAELIEVMKSRKITNITLPPSVLSVLNPDDFPTLKTVISAGERCTLDIARRWSQKHHFINGYGPTETTICASAYEVEKDFDKHHVPIGKPAHNMQVYILDQFMNPQPLGVPGEMYIGGIGLARGYYKRPDLTAERFVPNPFKTSDQDSTRLYKTGDLVRRLPYGNLEFIDRIDQQVKVRGFRIELGEIEANIKQISGVKEAVVIAREAGGDKRLIAYVVAADKDKFNAEQLPSRLKKQLPDFMIPSAVVVLDKIPLTSNNKLDRKKLPDPDMPDSGKTFVKPGSDLEKKLTAIWQEVLNVERIGINDSFFDLGGHSLSIVQVQGRIKEVFNKDINVVDMFKYPTISALAKFLGDESKTKEVIQKSVDRASRQREATKLHQQRMRNRRNPR